jgi:hypothetical protein
VEKVAFAYMLPIADYLNHKDDYHMVIFYDDIVQEPEREAKRLFEVLRGEKQPFGSLEQQI